MNNEQKKKLAQAQAKVSDATQVPGINIKVHGFEAMHKELDQLHTELQEYIKDDANQKRSEEYHAKLIDLSNTLVTTIAELEQSHALANEQTIKTVNKAFDDSIKSIKFPNPKEFPKGLATTGDIQKVADGLKAVVQEVSSIPTKLKPSQEPGEFIPYRRVIKQGNRLVFDDSIASGGGGGGGAAQTIIADEGGEKVTVTNGKLDVNATVSGSGDGNIQDGVDSNIKATVKDLANANPLTVAITDGSGDQITSFGGGTQYTEGDTDASITGTAVMWEDGSDTLRAVSAAKPLPIGDAGGSLTVDGTVSITANSSVNMAQVAGTATDTNSGTKSAGTQRVVLATDQPQLTNALKVDGSAVTQPVSYATTGSGTATGAIRVELPTNGTGTVGLNAGTNAIGKLAANSGVDIGDVDVTSVPADPFGANADAAVAAGATGSIQAKLRRLTTDIDAIKTSVAGTLTVGSHNVTNAGTFATQATSAGDVAHDGADSGNPVKTGGKATNVEPSAVSATGDRANFITDMVGKQITLPYSNPENFVSGAITSAMTGTTSTSLVAAPASGLRNYITQITVSNAHATVGTDIIIQDGSGGTTLYTIPAAAVYGGATLTFPTPLRQPTTATALYCANVTTGASTKVSASGYKGV